MPFVMLRLNTKRERPGIVSCTRESICSRDSRRTIGFASIVPRRISRSRWFKHLTGGNEFVAYLDAIGELDGKRCLIDWKTTTSRYPEEPEGLAFARSATHLLFVDHRNFRRWPWSCSCESMHPKFNI